MPITAEYYVHCELTVWYWIVTSCSSSSSGSGAGGRGTSRLDDHPHHI